MEVKIIVAMDAKGGIGKDGKLPWPPLNQDMKRFRQLTTGDNNNAVVMGRKTYESIPARNRPLKDRVNIVLSRNHEQYTSDKNTIYVGSVDDVICLTNVMNFDDVFVIGGAEIYKLFYKYCSNVFATQIDKTFNCDTFIDIDFSRYVRYADIGVVISDNRIQYRYINYDIKKIRNYKKC